MMIPPLSHHDLTISPLSRHDFVIIAPLLISSLSQPFLAVLSPLSHRVMSSSLEAYIIFSLVPDDPRRRPRVHVHPRAAHLPRQRAAHTRARRREGQSPSSLPSHQRPGAAIDFVSSCDPVISPFICHAMTTGIAKLFHYPLHVISPIFLAMISPLHYYVLYYNNYGIVRI